MHEEHQKVTHGPRSYRYRLGLQVYEMRAICRDNKISPGTPANRAFRIRVVVRFPSMTDPSSIGSSMAARCLNEHVSISGIAHVFGIGSLQIPSLIFEEAFRHFGKLFIEGMYGSFDDLVAKARHPSG